MLGHLDNDSGCMDIKSIPFRMFFFSVLRTWKSSMKQVYITLKYQKGDMTYWNGLWSLDTYFLKWYANSRAFLSLLP